MNNDKILYISKPNRPEIKEYFQRQLESVNTNTYTTQNCEFSKEDLENTIEMLNKLHPIATELQIHSEMVKPFIDSIPFIDYEDKPTETQGFIGMLTGIKLVGLGFDNEFGIKQGRILYSNGSEEIINIF